MSMIGSYRLVNAIENGTYATHGDLTTALGTTKTKVEFQGAVRNRELLRRLMSNEIAVPLILDSTAASPILYASNAEVLCDVLPDSYEFMNAVVTTYARFSKLNAIGGMIDALQKSANATKIINYNAAAEVFRRYPFYFTKVPFGEGPILEAAYSSTYGTTVFITATGVFYSKIGQFEFTKVAVGGGNFTPNDIAVNTDGTIMVIVGTIAASSTPTTTVYYSIDGGSSWLASNITTAAYSVLFGGAANIFAVICHTGSTISVHSSADGATWTSRYSGAISSTAPIIRVRAYNAGSYIFTLNAGASAVYVVTATTPTSTWTATNIATSTISPTGLAGFGATNFVLTAEGTGSDGYGYYCNGNLASWTVFTISDAGDWDPTNVVSTSSKFIYGIDNSSGGAQLGGNIAAAVSTTGVPTVTFIAAPADNIRTLVAAGRDLVLYTSDSTTYGVFVGSYDSPNLTTFRNSDGTVFTPHTTTPPFITPSGIYINALDGEVYCSNIPKK